MSGLTTKRNFFWGLPLVIARLKCICYLKWSLCLFFIAVFLSSTLSFCLLACFFVCLFPNMPVALPYGHFVLVVCEGCQGFKREGLESHYPGICNRFQYLIVYSVYRSYFLSHSKSFPYIIFNPYITTVSSYFWFSPTKIWG